MLSIATYWPGKNPWLIFVLTVTSSNPTEGSVTTISSNCTVSARGPTILFSWILKSNSREIVFRRSQNVSSKSGLLFVELTSALYASPPKTTLVFAVYDCVEDQVSWILPASSV